MYLKRGATSYRDEWLREFLGQLAQAGSYPRSQYNSTLDHARPASISERMKPTMV